MSNFAGTLPLQGSDVAVAWDNLYIFLFWLSVFFFVLVVGGMIYFAVAYRRQPGTKSKYITGDHLLETIWTVIPTILLMIIFGWGYVVYNQMTRSPADAMEIRVVGKQWLWQFQYDDGRTTVGELYVPIHKPVKLIMTSDDVLHSFFVPNFRVKQDVVPGMYTSVWFEANVPGKHQIYCTEYCGTSHSEMLGKVLVLEEDQWNAWKSGKKVDGILEAGAISSATPGDQVKVTSAAPTSLADQGKALAGTKGCVACHSDDGTKKVGPSFKGVFGHEVKIQDGSKVTADENYIRESILNPNVKIVQGYSPLMPTFKGLLSETELNAVIAYIKSLK